MIRHLLASDFCFLPGKPRTSIASRFKPYRCRATSTCSSGRAATSRCRSATTGIVLVDTQYERWRRKSSLRFANCPTSRFSGSSTPIDADHIGGNDALPKLANAATRQGVRIVAHENVVNRMTSAPTRSGSRCPGQAVAERRIFSSAKRFLVQRRGGGRLSHAGRAHRRRQHRAVPQFECA